MSAAWAWITGTSAPPAIAITSRPEPWLVSGPSSCTDMLKMVGNMIELNRPTSSTAHIAKWPWPKVVAISSAIQARSEEHTSELQSLAYLVCRLLLEKKKQ